MLVVAWYVGPAAGIVAGATGADITAGAAAAAARSVFPEKEGTGTAGGCGKTATKCEHEGHGCSSHLVDNVNFHLAYHLL